MTSTATAERTEETTEVTTPVEAPAQDLTPVKLSAKEQDTVIRTAGENSEKSEVPSNNQRAGEARAWDAKAQID